MRGYSISNKAYHAYSNSKRFGVIPVPIQILSFILRYASRLPSSNDVIEPRGPLVQPRIFPVGNPITHWRSLPKVTKCEVSPMLHYKKLDKPLTWKTEALKRIPFWIPRKNHIRSVVVKMTNKRNHHSLTELCGRQKNKMEPVHRKKKTIVMETNHTNHIHYRDPPGCEGKLSRWKCITRELEKNFANPFGSSPILIIMKIFVAEISRLENLINAQLFLYDDDDADIVSCFFEMKTGLMNNCMKVVLYTSIRFLSPRTFKRRTKLAKLVFGLVQCCRNLFMRRYSSIPEWIEPVWRLWWAVYSTITSKCSLRAVDAASFLFRCRCTLHYFVRRSAETSLVFRNKSKNMACRRGPPVIVEIWYVNCSRIYWEML